MVDRADACFGPDAGGRRRGRGPEAGERDEDREHPHGRGNAVSVGGRGRSLSPLILPAGTDRRPDRRWSGDEFEGVAVGGSHDGEVAVVHGGDRGQAEAFGDGDEAGVHEVEVQVAVSVAKLGAASPVN